MVATDVLLLVQYPPAVVSLSAVVAPMHVLAIPAITDADGKTVIAKAELQPVAKL
jgi:hypothetical protein